MPDSTFHIILNSTCVFGYFLVYIVLTNTLYTMSAVTISIEIYFTIWAKSTQAIRQRLCFFDFFIYLCMG